MYVSHVAQVPVPFEAATRRFDAIVGELTGWAHSAYVAGEQVQARIGIGKGSPVISKAVLLEIGQPTRRPQGLSLPVSWQATRTPQLFPRMEASLELSPATPDTTQIRFAGTYSVPFGSIGEFFDETVLHRVAERTVGNFIGRISEALART